MFALFRARLALQAFEFFTDHALRHVLAHGAQRAIDGGYPYYVVTEFDAPDAGQQEAALAAFERALEQGWVSDGVIAQSEAQAAALWRLREGITESLASARPYKNDISVRISAIPAFMQSMRDMFAREYPRYDVVWFGHIGDGNLHINIVRPYGLGDEAFVEECERVTALLSDRLARCGGSISAEHGIGLVKKKYLHGTRSAAEISVMRGIRNVLDPHGIMNPGKLFDA